MKATFSEINTKTGETKTREIKLCDGFRVNYDGQTVECANLSEVFETIGWNHENDPSEKEARDIFCREMFCFGCIDLTPCMPKGHTLTVNAIPCKD